MKNILNKCSVLSLLIMLIVSSCEDINVLENEQYIKQVYIVGASDVVWTFDVAYSDQPQNAYISVAVGGSKEIDKDVHVKLRHSDAVINWYNNKYMYDAAVKYRKLDEGNYSIPSMETVIQAGNVYSRLPFTINTNGLQCDSLYSLTFAIESADYDKNKVDTAIIMNLNLINDYSGVYQLTASKYKVTINNGAEVLSPIGSLSTTRTLKAVDANSVRFFNEAKAETRGGYASKKDYFDAIDNFGVKFTKGEDNIFSITSWKNLSIPAGECSYSSGMFTYHYDYMDGTTRYRIVGTLKK